MKLSLVIPVHNLEKYIEPMLVSLKYQTFDHDEVEPIFICDSCEDLTHDIIKVYLGSSYKNLVILDREYHSSGLARNDGIEKATGDYIWLLDGDDWLIDNHAIQKAMHFFEMKPDEDCLRVGFISNTYKHYDYPYTVWQWIWKAEMAKAVKFTSRPYDDDVEWVVNMMKAYFITTSPKWDEPFYFYNYMREGSVMSTRKENENNGSEIS